MSAAYFFPYSVVPRLVTFAHVDRHKERENGQFLSESLGKLVPECSVDLPEREKSTSDEMDKLWMFCDLCVVPGIAIG